MFHINELKLYCLPPERGKKEEKSMTSNMRVLPFRIGLLSPQYQIGDCRINKFKKDSSNHVGFLSYTIVLSEEERIVLNMTF